MDSSTRRRRRAATIVAAGIGASLLLTGCGFDMQTLQAYTPAHGVSIDVTAGENSRQLKVRNLLIVADDQGEGILSASIVSPVDDELVRVEGAAHTMDNQVGSPLTVTGSPVELTANRLAVLTDPTAAFTVSSPDLQPGLTVDLKLTFASGLEASAIAPVMSAEDPVYGAVSAAPSAAASPTASPAASPSPSPTATPTP
ncbi:MAG: hypothetical protein Q4F65_06705 [Propionibacteriaceae bacterium]|nr:hypothetical protein [Propionibacteriaceae bacterium]